jgi:hypothetical protein
MKGTMTMNVGTKRQLENLANFGEADFDQDMIRDWAKSDDGGGLPYPSALAFSVWLDSGWNEFEDPEQDQTNLDVLTSGLSEWTGGRVTVAVSKDLRSAFAKAEQAHAALYAGVDDPDAPEDNGWRRGPHPIALADFFAALAAAAPGLFNDLRN